MNAWKIKATASTSALWFRSSSQRSEEGVQRTGISRCRPSNIQMFSRVEIRFNRRFIQNPLMCGFMKLPSGDVSELLEHPRTFKGPSCSILPRMSWEITKTRKTTQALFYFTRFCSYKYPFVDCCDCETFGSDPRRLAIASTGSTWYYNLLIGEFIQSALSHIHRHPLKAWDHRPPLLRSRILTAFH